MENMWIVAALVFAALLNGAIGRKRGADGVKIMYESEIFVFAVLTVLSMLFGSGAVTLCFTASTVLLIIGYLRKSSIDGFGK